MVWTSNLFSGISLIPFLLLITIASNAFVHSLIPDAEAEIRRLDQLQSKISERRRVLEYVRKTTPELIEAQGYPAEIHSVVTEDGYILEMHRIPHGIKNQSHTAGPRPVVYLQHCLLCSSSVWVLNSPDRALAYILADAGYDVWMGNARGSTYSKKHNRFNPTSDEYWQFSWAEMGKYDAPAMIDHVLNTTQQKQLYYVGFSMGTTIFFTMMHYHPQYNDKIRGMVALSPVAYVGNAKGPWPSVYGYVPLLEKLFRMSGINELLASTNVFDMLISSLCAPASRLSARLCQSIVFWLTGPSPEQQYKDYLPVLLSHTPAGTSTRTILHYLQIGRAGKFQNYDHGFFGNFLHYGQPTPQAYDLSKVTAPVIAFYSDNDILVTPNDARRTISEMSNVIASFSLRNKNFSHVDFVWARDAVTEVYLPLLKALQRF